MCYSEAQNIAINSKPSGQKHMFPAGIFFLKAQRKWNAYEERKTENFCTV